MGATTDVEARDDRLDGNAAAGALGALFAVEVTTMVVTCAGCGRSGVVGELAAYITAIGTVLRCPSCDHALIRMMEGPGQTRFDLRGVRVLAVASPP